MRPPRNPFKVDCRCGCLGVQEYHEAGERVRRDMLVDRPAARCAPVLQGKQSTRPQFGVQRPAAIDPADIMPVDLEAIA